MNNQNMQKMLANTIVIVSGLPRSGTSMMMQVLEAGGLEILSDHKRQADHSNPKGYYELEAVKRLDKDNSIIKEAQGKVIKVISHLLEYLPMEFNYKIIFMNRDMEEILRSQQKMLGEAEDKYPPEMVEIFQKELNNVKIWMEENANKVDVLKVNYSDMILDPLPQIKRIIEFLNFPLNEDKMLEAIDPNLYRNRART
ncbi:MAG: sulfotransferase [Promethearchaeota archaeon]